MSRKVAVATSLLATLMSLLLLHRVLRRADADVSCLLPGALRGLAGEERAYLAAVAAGCGWAIWRRRAEALGWVQLCALVCGLWLMQYRWGEQAGKLDPRFWFALVAGVATLHACYLCLVAHGVIVMSEWFRRRSSR